jgi:hypothetical protein
MKKILVQEKKKTPKAGLEVRIKLIFDGYE